MMALKSVAQYERLKSIDPDMAERWKAETPHFDKLPDRVGHAKKEPSKAAQRGGGGMFDSMKGKR